MIAEKLGRGYAATPMASASMLVLFYVSEPTVESIPRGGL